jgi:hypothetical protein
MKGRPQHKFRSLEQGAIEKTGYSAADGDGRAGELWPRKCRNRAAGAHETVNCVESFGPGAVDPPASVCLTIGPISAAQAEVRRLAVAFQRPTVLGIGEWQYLLSREMTAWHSQPLGSRVAFPGTYRRADAIHEICRVEWLLHIANSSSFQSGFP